MQHPENPLFFHPRFPLKMRLCLRLISSAVTLTLMGLKAAGCLSARAPWKILSFSFCRAHRFYSNNNNHNHRPAADSGEGCCKDASLIIPHQPCWGELIRDGSVTGSNLISGPFSGWCGYCRSWLGSEWKSIFWHSKLWLKVRFWVQRFGLWTPGLWMMWLTPWLRLPCLFLVFTSWVRGFQACFDFYAAANHFRLFQKNMVFYFPRTSDIKGTRRRRVCFCRIFFNPPVWIMWH